MKKPIGLFHHPGLAKCLSKVLLIPALCLGFCVSVSAQTRTITGKVLSDDGPAPGATVAVQGTNTVALTDADGEFSLAVPADATIEISYFGYRTEVIPVGSRSRFDVSLTADVNVMETVIAIGYGTQKKALNTGATLNVTGDAIAKRNTLTPLQALQGQTPGMLITQDSGQPGKGMTVIIRGQGTNGDTAPLYIIDGVPGDLSLVNPADIQSIDVLKDAASAAIYGAQAANGVVLVTTRQGSKGRAQVTFDMYYGIQNVARYAPMLNAEQYKIIMNEQAVNSGAPIHDFAAMAEAGYGADTNWVKEMFVKNAAMQNYSVGITGGTDVSNYLISFNYTGQEGIAGGREVSNYERYGFRINTEHKLFGDLLTVGENLNLTFRNDTGIPDQGVYWNGLRSAFSVSPITPLYGPNQFGSKYNDTTGSPWNDKDGNPVGMMMEGRGRNLNRNQNLFGNIYAVLRPLEGLQIRSSLGLDQSSYNSRGYQPLYSFSADSHNKEHTRANQSAGGGHILTWVNTANYDFTVADDHAIGVMIGMEAIRNSGVNVSAENVDLQSQFDSWEYAWVDNTRGQDVSLKRAGGSPWDMERRVSYFGRATYNYKEKYLFNATLRRDGSGKYAKGYRWGTFPSVSAGWVVSNEPFMERLVSSRALDYLKLRASWGQVGNQNARYFQYAAPINTGAWYVFGDPKTANTQGAYPNRLPNPELSWETSQQINVGIDARFFGGRLDMNLDWYQKTTIDWIVRAPVLATAGAEAPDINGGDVRNSGVELSFSWADRIGDFSYRIGLNGAYNKNSVGNIATRDKMIHGAIQGLYNNSPESWRVEKGHAIGYFWGFQTAGIFQNQQQIDEHRAAGLGFLQPNPVPGDVIFVDQNRNGSVGDEDKVDIGDGIPDWTAGFNIELGWKGIDLAINGYGMFDYQIAQSYRDQGNKYGNYTTAILDRWTGEGTSNRIPRVTDTNVNWFFSDLFLHKADFLRVSNIALGYDLARVINVNWMSKFRIYTQVQNPFTFTKYNGMDPEIAFGSPDNPWVHGVDVGFYPRPRIVMFGASLTF